METKWTAADTERVRAFADQARSLLDLQWKRAEIFERRASVLLGFSAAALPVLLLNVTGRLSDASRLRSATGLLLLLATLALATTAACCLSAMRSKTFRSPDFDQLRNEWRAYDQDAKQHPAYLAAMFTDSLIGKNAGHTGTIESVTNDADARARSVRAASWALAFAILLVGAAFAYELWEGVIR